MSKKATSSRLSWSKIPVPPELSDLLYMVAVKHGYRREQIHHFIYDMLKEKYPDDIDKLSDYLETRWLEDRD